MFLILAKCLVGMGYVAKLKKMQKNSPIFIFENGLSVVKFCMLLYNKFKVVMRMSESIFTDPVKLEMHEKLNELRREKGLRIEDVAKEIGVSTATLSRFEKIPDAYIPYQNLVALAIFYDVSMDYMCGFTLHRKHREIPLDELHLTDDAVDFLKNNKNVRLLNELLSTKIFPELLTTAEVFVNGKNTAGYDMANSMYATAESHIKSLVDVDPQDEIMAVIKEAQVNQDDYLRFRLTERFDDLLKDIRDERKKYADENIMSINEYLKENMEELIRDKQTKEKEPFYCVAKTLGLNFEDVPKDKLAIFEEILTDSDLYKLMVGQTTATMPRSQRRKLERESKEKK